MGEEKGDLAKKRGRTIRLERREPKSFPISGGLTAPQRKGFIAAPRRLNPAVPYKSNLE